MCWSSRYKTIKECVRVAKEDVTVRKIGIVREGQQYDFCSYFKEFGYFFGKEYKVDYNRPYYAKPEDILDDFGDNNWFSINEGIHSYSTECNFANESRCYLKVICPGGGVNVEAYSKKHKLIIVDCIIPKGTMYLENSFGEIVSSRIIPKCATNIELEGLKYNHLK